MHEHARSVIESKYTLGVWTWSAYSYLLLPVWALQWTLHLPHISEVKEIEGEDEGEGEGEGEEVTSEGVTSEGIGDGKDKTE